VTLEEEQVVARFSTGSYLLSRSDVEAIGVPVQEESLQEVELRCPTGPRKLFAKLRLAGVQPAVTSDNLVELACQDCRRRMRSEGRDVQLVLHRYDIVGALIETVVVDRDQT
jgi:hypothetical protein